MHHITFRNQVALNKTMMFESVYPEQLRMCLAGKRELRKTPGSIFVWMFVDGAMAGESYGVPLLGHDEPIEGLLLLPEKQKAQAVYCYSNTMLPAFQKRGLGAVLKAYWLGVVAGRGFRVVYGHARAGGSQALNAKFGATFLESYPDWFETGEEYKLYRLRLPPKP